MGRQLKELKNWATQRGNNNGDNTTLDFKTEKKTFKDTFSKYEPKDKIKKRPSLNAAKRVEGSKTGIYGTGYSKTLNNIIQSESF